jgi:hypothetical protein
VAPVIDLEAKPDGKTVVVADQPDKQTSLPLVPRRSTHKDTAQDEVEQPIQPTLKL